MHAPSSMRAQRTRTQRGAALLAAMLTVTLVATFAAASLWQQWRAIEVETAERDRVQAAWILVGALDWSRLILREDGRAGGADHLAEPWAVPLQEARLSSFLAAERGAADQGRRVETVIVEDDGAEAVAEEKPCVRTIERDFPVAHMGGGVRVDAENPVAVGPVLAAAVGAQIVHDRGVLEGAFAGAEGGDEFRRAADGARLARSVLDAEDLRLVAVVFQQDQTAISEVAAGELALAGMKKRQGRARPFVAAVWRAELPLREAERERLDGVADEAVEIGAVAHGVFGKERARFMGEPVRAGFALEDRRVGDVGRTVDHPGRGGRAAESVFVGLVRVAGAGEDFEDREHGCKATRRIRA